MASSTDTPAVSSNLTLNAPTRQARHRDMQMVRGSFLLMVLLMLVSAAVIYRMGESALAIDRDIVHHSQAVTHLQSLLSTLQDAETGQRGYLLTGNPNYLEPYRDGTQEVRAALAAVRSDDTMSQTTGQELEQLINEKLEEMEQTVVLRREKGLEAATAVVKSDFGRKTMDAIRKLIEDMSQSEQKAIAEHQQQLHKTVNYRTATYIIAAVINLAFLYYAFSRIREAFQDRNRWETQLMEQKQLLAVTLASIGDGVIVTDTAGTVTFMNDVAEKLTGWKNDEAQGQPCGTVFHIVNETTRERVESPVDKVLREGTIIGLANHTQLIHRDGSEVPIDDSGAPIRDPSGKTRGVVLVFRDFSEHKKAEQEIRRLNAELRTKLNELETIFNVVPVGLAVVMDPSCNRVRYNPYFATMLQIPINDQKGGAFQESDTPSNFTPYWNGSDLPADTTPARLAAATGKPVENIDLKLVFRDGRVVTLYGNAAPLFDENGKCRGAIGCYVNVTDRRRVEEEALRLASIVEHSSDFIGISDIEGKPIYVNNAGMALMGLQNLGEAKRLPVVEYFVPEDREFVRNTVITTALREGRWAGELRFRHYVTGAAIPVLYDIFRVDDPQTGKPINYATITRNITERKRAEAQLQRAKEEAESANIAKDNFLATLSHELRTPLTPVAAILASWEINRLAPDNLMPDVQMMRRNVDLEARLIDDLLDLTRIVRGKLTLNPEFTDVHELLNAVVNIYQSEIQAKGLRLKLQLEAKRHVVHADPARLQQVFWNILKNSTKFTPEGGSIEVSTSSDSDGWIRLKIRDTGIGMTPELQARLFKPFEQGAAERVRRYGGLGLGLAISKTLVEAQKGVIAAESAGPGNGSTFTVSLPVADVENHQPANKPVESPAKLDCALRILMVEDHADTARVMARLLQGLGHTITLAGTVTKAREIFDASEFDLLLSDIGLPDGTGIDLIKYIRQSHKIPAIAMTGFGMEEDIARCKAAGFDEHLTKPVNFQRLQLVIDEVAKKSAHAQRQA